MKAFTLLTLALLVSGCGGGGGGTALTNTSTGLGTVANPSNYTLPSAVSTVPPQ